MVVLLDLGYHLVVERVLLTQNSGFNNVYYLLVVPWTKGVENIQI